MDNACQSGRRHTPPAPHKPQAASTDAGAAFPDEIAHLHEINTKLDDACRTADRAVHRIDEEYNTFKRYMVENRGEIDPHEMFQNEQSLMRIDQSGVRAVDQRDRLTKLKDSPYFARVDFVPRHGQQADAYYIGRFGFLQDHERLILDWRSPVAGMFYDCEIGPAAYTTPTGRVQGRLTRKRQFKISGGAMEYVLESDVNIQDTVLQRELSHTSDEKMKSIIHTIQKEQNKIIRNETTDTLIIQGVAGSGKTSVALHRIAFLLYRFQGSLLAENVAILSPNKVFGDYISQVLPELGEEPVLQVSLAEIAEIQLGGVIRFTQEPDPFATPDTKRAERIRVKSTPEFLERLEQYKRHMADHVLLASDCAFGAFTAESGWIQRRFAGYAQYPVKQRLRRIADDLYSRFETESYLPGDLPKKSEIAKALQGMLRIKTSLALYKDFYRQPGLAGLLSMPDSKTLEWADVFPFLYLHAAFAGLTENRGIKHLVIDEMQDYTPVQFAVLNLLFPCPKTILGDFGQRVHPDHRHTLRDIRRLYGGAVFVELNTSYRSTYEIVQFAARLQQAFPLEAVARHGEVPAVLPFAAPEEELAYLKKRMQSFQNGCFATLGIITKTNQEAERLFAALSGFTGITLLSPASRRFVNGVCVASVAMSKGLEFDAVIIPSADDTAYRTEYDRALLYIACTRAMHRLTLTYTGRRTALLGDRA